jgi:hypothetical protein
LKCFGSVSEKRKKTSYLCITSMTEPTIDLELEVASAQSLLRDSLDKFSDTNVEYSRVPSVLKLARICPPDVVSEWLGDLGLPLSRLLEFYYLDHPAIGEYTSAFSSPDLSAEIEEALEVGMYARQLGLELNGIKELFRHRFSNLVLARFFIHKFTFSPPIRAAKEADVRSRLRSQNTLASAGGSIQFTELALEGLVDWSQVPSSMASFIRLNYTCALDCGDRKKVVEKFRYMGMDSQAKTYETFLKSFDTPKSNYFGFYEEDVEKIMMILGKVHGFTMSSNPFNNTPYLDPNKNPNLMRFLFSTVGMAPHYLRVIMQKVGEKWNIDDPSTIMEALECTKKMPIWKSVAESIVAPHPPFNYRARAYYATSPVMQKLMPVHVRQLIALLEQYPEMRDMPIFDNFILLVPTIRLSDLCYNESHQGFFIHDGRMLRAFEKREEASVFLDLMMIRARAVVPFLLGQQGRNVYPIGYWA